MPTSAIPLRWALMAQVQKEFGGLDILVNNAGILRDRRLRNVHRGMGERVARESHWRIQLPSPFPWPSCAGGQGQGGEHFVCGCATWLSGIGQLFREQGRGGGAGRKSRRGNLARQQITVNAVAPGFINTEIHKGLSRKSSKTLSPKIPAGRFGEVTTSSPPFLFLCSDQARYITGQVLHVNGGFYM